MQRLLFFCGLAVLLSGLALGQAKIPPPPADGSLLYDGARVLQIYDRERIGEAQQALAEQGVPMGVATIRDCSRYGAAPDMEAFARKWALDWELNADGNDLWVMVLLSVGDGRAGIKLGPGWEEGFERVQARIMSEGMVPRFQEERYHDGLIYGAEELQEALSHGLVHGPPRLSGKELVIDRFQVFESTSFFSAETAAVLTGVGLFFLVLACFAGEVRVTFGGIGLLIIGVACFGNLVIPCLVVGFFLLIDYLGGNGNGPGRRILGLRRSRFGRGWSGGSGLGGGGGVTGSW